MKHSHTTPSRPPTTSPRPKAVWEFLVCLLLWLTTLPVAAQVNTENIIRMGHNAIYFDDYLAAIRFFNQAIEAKPHQYKPYYYRAYAKFTLEDYPGAEEDCTRAIDLHPYITEIYGLRGLCRIHNSNYQGAIDDYSRVLSDEPSDQGARYNRALCLLELKQFDDADNDLTEILKRSPRHYKAYMVKAQVCFEKKDTLEGLRWVNTLLTLNPNEASAWAFKGRYAVQKDNYAQADSFLTRAIKLQPELFENYLARAIARNGMNRFSGALADYDKVIEIIPQHFVAHYNRGLLRARVGDNNRAIEDFDFILEVEPDNTLALYNRALLREKTGNYRGAADDYTRIIKDFPNFIYGYAARARCRRKYGDTRGAVSDETRVYRAELDLMFEGGRKKQNIKKVRLRSDRSLEQYEQLIAEDTDTTGTYVRELLGKVQNRKVERLPIASLALTLEPARTDNKHTTAFMPEVEQLNADRLTHERIVLSTGLETAEDLSLQHLQASLNRLNARIETASTPTLLLQRSALHAAVYNYEDALQDARAAVQADSTLVPAHLQCTAMLLRQCATQKEEMPDNLAMAALSAEALRQAEAAVRLQPENAYTYYNRGCAHLQRNNRKAAMEDFTHAIRLDPQLAEAYYNRAVIHLLQGENDKAIPDLSRAGEAGLHRAYNLLKQARGKQK